MALITYVRRVVETNDFQERVRELSIRLRNFQVCESMDNITAELRSDDGDSQGAGVLYTVALKGSRLTITYNRDRDRTITLYSGPIDWLKGSINYDKPLDDQ